MIKNLLLIDDDTIYSYIFPEIIRDSGLVQNFHIENDGLCGLNYLESCKGNFPDLILLDLKMPVLDGLGFLEEYGPRFASKYPHTIILVMTSSVRQKDKDAVMTHSFVREFLSKPITDSLIEEITDKYFLVK